MLTLVNKLSLSTQTPEEADNAPQNDRRDNPEQSNAKPAQSRGSQLNLSPALKGSSKFNCPIYIWQHLSRY